MKTNKITIFGMVLLAVVMLCAAGCTKDNGLGSGLQGWYTDLSQPAQQSDFNEINTAINNHELLSSYGSGNNYYATYDLFIDDEVVELFRVFQVSRQAEELGQQNHLGPSDRR